MLESRKPWLTLLAECQLTWNRWRLGERLTLCICSLLFCCHFIPCTLLRRSVKRNANFVIPRLYNKKYSCRCALTIKHYTVRTYGGDVYMHEFLISVLVGGEWSASRPGRFTPGEISPTTHWIGNWVAPRSGLDDVEKRKYLILPGLEFRPPVVQPVVNRYRDCNILINIS
jgi:hypothetical protein